MYVKCWQCGEEIEVPGRDNMSSHDPANIYLQDPNDRVEYVANVMMKSYKSDARTWYDLAKAAIAAVEKYNHLSRKTD